MAGENELVRLAQSGDRNAFDLLAKECADKIYNLSFRLTGNIDDAKDLWQDSIIKAYKTISKFKRKCSFSSWLYQITANLWKDKIKHEKRLSSLKSLPLDELIKTEDGEIVRELPDSLGDPASELDQRQKNEMVWKMLNELDSQTRMIIVLCIIENRTYKEVSKLAGCSLRTVNSKVNRVRELFREKLTAYLGG